jgi:hypothetical protein
MLVDFAEEAALVHLNGQYGDAVARRRQAPLSENDVDFLTFCLSEGGVILIVEGIGLLMFILVRGQ